MRALLARGWPLLVMLGVGACLTVPFAMRPAVDTQWLNVLYFLEAMRANLVAGRLDLYFLHTPASGAFYPLFVFYGGGAFTVLGALAVVAGSWPVFLLSTWAGYVLAMVGVVLLTRALGAPRWLAVLLAVGFSVSPYSVTNLYGRGSWGELVGSGIGLCVLGLAARVLARRRSEVSWEVVLFVLAVAALAGTHNISLLLTGSVGGLILLALLPMLVPRDCSGRVVAANVGWLAGGGMLGLAMVAYWLVPNLWLGMRTRLGDTGIYPLAGFSDLGTVFAPWLRFTEAQASVITGSLYGLAVPTSIYIQTLSLLLVPIIVGCAVALARRGIPGRWWLSVAVLVVLGVMVSVLIDQESAFRLLPDAFSRIQFTYRLVTFMTLVLVLLAALVALLGNRLVAGLIVSVVLWYAGLAIAQPVVIGVFAGNYRPTWELASGDPPPAHPPDDYLIPEERRLQVPTVGLPPLPLNVGPDGSVASVPPPGEYLTTVACSPLVQVVNGSLLSGSSEGARCVIAVRPASVSPVVAPAWPLARVAGLVLSVTGVAGWLGLAGLTAARARRRRSVRGAAHRVTA